MRGIVWDGERLHVTDALSVRAPGVGEVRVRVLASGICHSDLNMMDHRLAPTPIVLGHEGAGVIDALGPDVTGFAIGEPVALTTQTPCGHCRECLSDRTVDCPEAWGHSPPQPFEWNGRPTYSFANTSTFAQQVIVKPSQLFRSIGLPPEQAALIGCAVSTGVGAVRVLGGVRAGDTVLVIGIGGIGVNALQAARLAGATRVVALDVNPGKQAIAARFGADLFLCADRSGDAAALRRLVTGAVPAVDVVVECSGAPAAMEAAVSLPRRGGACVLVGQPRPGTRIGFDALEFTMGGAIVAKLNGGTVPSRDFPTLIDEARTGRIDVAGQVEHVWPLGQVEDAIAALRAGSVIRAVLDMT